MKELLVICFIVMMVGVGLYSRKKVNDVNDFFLGGRNMGPWMSAFAYGSSYFSAVIFIGYAGSMGWTYGISSIWIGVCNAVIGCFLAWKILAKRTRKVTHELGASTLPDFFNKRYNSKYMKVVASLVIFVFLVPYTASVYKGLGYIFESSFGISFNTAILLMALLTGLYLVLGGYVATAINDFIQGIIMLGGCILMVIYVTSHPNVGGISNGMKTLAEIDPGLVTVFSDSSRWLSLLGLVLMTSFGVWGLPQMLHKFYAIKDEEAIKRGTIISTVFALVIGISTYLTGTFGRLYFLQDGVSVMPQNNPDMIIPIVLETALPEVLFGIIIVLVLSASMSTLSSLVLVSSSTLTMDVIKGMIVPDLSEKKAMLYMKAGCMLFVLLSYVIATSGTSTIVALMSLSWGMISGMFLGPYVCGICSRKANRVGAWAGMIIGASVMLGYIIGSNTGVITIDLPLVASIAMISSVVGTWGGSSLYNYRVRIACKEIEVR